MKYLEFHQYFLQASLALFFIILLSILLLMNLYFTLNLLTSLFDCFLIFFSKELVFYKTYVLKSRVFPLSIMEVLFGLINQISKKEAIFLLKIFQSSLIRQRLLIQDFKIDLIKVKHFEKFRSLGKSTDIIIQINKLFLQKL